VPWSMGGRAEIRRGTKVVTSQEVPSSLPDALWEAIDAVQAD
jgi:hypothetical protein